MMDEAEGVYTGHRQASDRLTRAGSENPFDEEVTKMNRGKIIQGVYGGLIGGSVFGAMMGMMGMLPIKTAA